MKMHLEEKEWLLFVNKLRWQSIWGAGDEQQIRAECKLALPVKHPLPRTKDFLYGEASQGPLPLSGRPGKLKMVFILAVSTGET